MQGSLILMVEPGNETHLKVIKIWFPEIIQGSHKKWTLKKMTKDLDHVRRNRTKSEMVKKFIFL